MHTSKTFLGLALLLFAPSCSHRYYAPNTIQMPALRASGDAVANVGLAVGPEYSGVEAHAAYSPAKHTALMINYFRASSDKDKVPDNITPGGSNEPQWGKGQFLEGAVGGYLPLDERNTLSMFVGMGEGSTYNYFGLSRFADLRFRRWFVQPSITAEYNRVRLGFGLRFARLKFYRGLVDYRIDEQEREVIERLVEDSPMFLPEYALHFSWKMGIFSINNTVTYSPSQAAQKDNRFAGSNLNLGLGVDLHKFWKKQ
ncbi:MAG: hypothetical protein ACK4Q5_02175 [Saprospiraceae bacterium]